MKKLLAFLLLFKLSIAGASADSIKTTINCTIHGLKKEGGLNELPSGLFLYELKNGEAVSLGFQRPDAQGNCSFDLDVKEGVYFFKKAGGHGLDFKYTIYIKAGEQKKVDFYLGNLSIDYDSCVITKPNVETKCLQAWLEAMNKYKKETMQIPLGNSLVKKYGQFQKITASFLASNKTANTFFNAWLADKVYTDLQYVRAASYFRFGRVNTRYDSSAAVQSFYKPLYNQKIINDARSLRSEHGMELLDYTFGYWKVNEGSSQEKVVANYFSPENASKISNSTVKVAFLLHKMPGIKKYEDFVKYVQPNKNLFVTEKQKAAYSKAYNDLGPFAKGNLGYNFELKDINDKTYTLAGFKGKVVVIDMWAMWCAPCLAEKPVMEKIAESYHDRNDIVFVGVSTDGLSKKEVWKAFVKKRGFTSIELLSNHTESIQKYYMIEGIPRFLIFDKEGKIVTVDAPRPSDPAFKKLIDQTLGLK
ncbi:TlpA family protein disulfide reductase [Chitinophagaceae bacterium LB-8]|uniref:TlpA family protein disulfide reductase n=1 Tax=Paraflavisolibacter caeni TaxID=2982496 RepID=A0A9X2XNI1_9BACT|nr:TlpA disulfide reductase family protein [Paraflavisolibacter caeni]MCU7548818.1 TlpA family protein disulfide reductase [Paraflavisolibacter caeni]